MRISRKIPVGGINQKNLGDHPRPLTLRENIKEATQRGSTQNGFSLTGALSSPNLVSYRRGHAQME